MGGRTLAISVMINSAGSQPITIDSTFVAAYNLPGGETCPNNSSPTDILVS